MTKYLSIKTALYVYAGVYPLLMFFSLERLNPVSSSGLFSNFPLNIVALTVSVTILFLIALIVYSFVGSVFLSYTIVTIFFLSLYILNHFKVQLTGGVLVPSDIRLVGAAFGVIDRDMVVIELTFIFRVLLTMILLAPLYFCKLQIALRKRMLALPAACIAVFLVLFAAHGFGLTSGHTFNRYRDSGFIIGFFSEMVYRNTNALFDIPPNEISKRFTLTDVQLRDLPQNPNVIVIMSEAFFDPNVLPNITFSQNPVPNFHRLSEAHLHGRLVVPAFGGGTANTEFEFLGGSPHVFFGTRWYVPFENIFRYFNRDITTTLPWMFRQNGYRTVGVHTFRGDFFNRNRIYPRIGFDVFLSAEDMPNAVFRGDFISDEYFTDRIIEQILIAEDYGTPLFLFGISMQNHWPYTESRYGDIVLDVKAFSPYLSCEEIGVVNTFAQGVFDADRQLGRLIAFIEGRETPSIVVFFGDHLPIMGTHEMRIFEKLGFLSVQDAWEWKLQDLKNAYKTDYLVWANFELDIECFGTVSSFLLGALIAQAAGVQLNRYFLYLLGAAESLRVLTNELYLPADGVFAYGYMGRHTVNAHMLEALWQHKMFGGSEFSQSLRELVARHE